MTCILRNEVMQRVNKAKFLDVVADTNLIFNDSYQPTSSDKRSVSIVTPWRLHIATTWLWSSLSGSENGLEKYFLYFFCQYYYHISIVVNMHWRDLECQTINPCICNSLYRHLFLINHFCYCRYAEAVGELPN